MTLYEFVARTGYTPTEKQFETIHKEYMDAGQSVDKDTFCKEWKKNGGIEKASMEAQREIWVLQGAKEEAIRQATEAIKKVKELEKQLKEANERIKEIEEQDEKVCKRNIMLRDKINYSKQLIDVISRTLSYVE